MSALPYGPASLGMRPFDPELFPEERLGPYGFTKLTEPQKDKLISEWHELIKEFPLSHFTAKEAATLAKIRVKDIHRLAREGHLVRRLFQRNYWIQPASLLAYLVETRREGS